MALSAASPLFKRVGPGQLYLAPAPTADPGTATPASTTDGYYGLFYTTPGRKRTRLMAITRVALGKMKDYTQITYGLSEPPSGYHSCHGVRALPSRPSQFADDEYVVYKTQQQRLETLVEFTC